jgi:hypothetical protein
VLNRLKELPVNKAYVIGSIMGVVYGVLARAVAATGVGEGLFGVMSLAFVFIVPVTMGVLTVSQVEQPSFAYRVFGPWIPTVLVVLVAFLFGWEGAICVIMALPILLFFASLGGLLGASRSARRSGVTPALAMVPFLIAPIEHGIRSPERLTETVTEIEIAAPPAIVWPLIASVDSIRPNEQRHALFTSMGFPRPVSATLSRPGVGGIRSARFERGLVFTETVTDWAPDHRLSFTIDPNTNAIPATTLDPHVTIGGPFFDVLTGTYELYPTNSGHGTRLILRSAHRVSTHFNFYAGWWANRIMASIQANILAVHKVRAESRREDKTTARDDLTL